ncbi:hypothetical protein M413DRAFT_23079 [Hebeloma cylindrosporum]|uniref:ubiquitinyl hydrolase 1 n=1 Tax=Hebeloma cylindrosporum TaxID=76867 RepID=A0A0C2Z0M9_HEBCY|nr:hypothetical protein M413DRAFT_23079 [Hebeloma cylindrosporum h7]
MANANPEQEDILRYVLNHVFLPPKLPQEDDYDAERDAALCRFAYDASLEFGAFLSQSQQAQWSTVSQMLKNMLESTRVLDKDVLVTNISHLEIGAVLVYHIRGQNAAVILRRLQHTVVFEVFEVSPLPEAVMAIEGKLICSYPGPAVELPLEVARDSSFVEQLVNFLVQMHIDRLPGAEATTTKAGSKVPETRGTTHPKYISQLLIMILRGMGSEATVNRITKRIADEVCWNNALNPWRRSPLWLVLRVAIQTTADSRETYKAFMVFFQARLLQLFIDHDLPSELLHAARVKTSRRIHKLGASAPPRLLQAMAALSQKVKECLELRWSTAQHLQEFSPSYTPYPATVEKDTIISLLESRTYLARILSPESYTDTFTKFHPSNFPRLRDLHDLAPSGLTKAVQADGRIALADFEFLVQEQLDSWVMENRHLESGCKTLGSLLGQYISASQAHYSSNPEDESLMLLTIMELWVALDTIAGVKCPLLLSYSPVIPASFLNPLLLRRAKSIERAAQIERYIRRRHSNATIATSIFSDQLNRDTFAVRFFQASPILHAARASIESHAATMRENKRKELQEFNERHRLLTLEVATLSCNFSGSYRRAKHTKACSKCMLQKRADKMCIEVHEWPLPHHPLESEATVFELNCPPVFAIWRTCTYRILRDIGMAHVPAQSRFSPKVLLEDYKGLANWSIKGTSGRITIGSETKSFLQSHYRATKIPAEEDRVCVNNGLRFRLYDTVKEEHVLSTFDLNLDSYCTLRILEDGEGLYCGLQYAVSHTTHAHNDTIVNQGACPSNLSIHEHLAFSNLRCGSHLQWMNIARELRSNILTFSREEVHTLLTQAAWQIGPLSNDGLTRDWHFELGVSGFGLVLIREAMDLLSSVEANWIEGTTVKSIIYLASRLLASTLDWQVRENAYRLLGKARNMTHNWMLEIVNKLQDAVDDDQASELQRRACDMAATCRATFDVDPAHLNALLLSSADVAIAIECAIVLHDNIPPHFGHAFLDLQKLLNRDHRLSHFLESPLIKLIQADRRGIDAAITSVWSAYRPGNGGWRQLDEPNSRWLTSFTASLPNQRAQQVHYNILNGELLVDGKSLGCLPQEIVGHSIYKRIFGQKILDIIPADMPGMDYATRNLVHGYHIFFAMRGSSRLIIRARCGSGRVLELIPHEVLLGDFPTFFITEHTHWMDVQSGEVEFRPLDRLWDPSPHNWRLVFHPNAGSRMIHGTPATRYLLDIRSGTFQGLAARVRPLEYSEYLTVFLDNSYRISIELPRFRLSFFAHGGELESKNMQGMVIDDNQCTGTMIGLSTQLVLRHKDSTFASLPRSRCVLIPRGNVHFALSTDQNHVRVHIDTRTNFKRRVTWDKYEIDTDLGLLVGNVNLTSRFYRIYLHALCSNSLPDPLTGQTGTDHTLQELQAAGSFSFQKLTEADVELLRLIGNLTPRREYYPQHLSAMQTTHWSPQLPALSQHSMFDTAIGKILDYGRSLSAFAGPKDNDIDLDYKQESAPVLMARAAQRNSVYYEGGFKTSADLDRRYNSRDLPHIADHDSCAVEALKTSRLVYAWPPGLTRHIEPSELIETFKAWGNMSGPMEGTSLMYTREWLRLDLPAKWLSIYDLCRQAGQNAAKYELVFSFAALSFSSASLREFIPVLLAFATMPESLFIAPPLHLSYDLEVGFEPIRKQVRNIIVSGTRPLGSSPSSRLLQLPNENILDFYIRQRAHYDDQISYRTDGAADRLMIESNSSFPQSPFNQADDPSWFNIEKIMGDATKYFASCSRNRDLRSFASQVTVILEGNYKAPPKLDSRIPIFGFVPQLDVCLRPTDSSFTLESLLSFRACPAIAHSFCEAAIGAHVKPRPLDQPVDTGVLEDLISQFRSKGCSNLTQLYSERLESSRRELHGQQTPVLPQHTPPRGDCLAFRDRCKSRLRELFSSIRSSLSPSTTTERILADAGLWPRIHHRSILQPLASTANICPSPEWAGILAAFAEVFIEYQHSQRLLGYALQSDAEKFYKELDSASFNRRDAVRIPDWLLIQIQSNFITRTIQYDVAREMIDPSSNASTILQLNMGEGKSHVIVPLVAAALADSRKLVRVVVLKPLAGQMFHLLVERISGLSNRRIFYLPFSRDITMNTQQIQHIRNLFEECARVQGVLVAQPEHILSFRLMVVDRILSSGFPLNPIAQNLQDMQKWLTSTSRDILDESDEILHVRYQLIYTMDHQQPLDDGQDRWTTTQNIFDLVRRHTRKIHELVPGEVELLEHRAVEGFQGKFLHVRLLGVSASEALVSCIAEDALNGALENLTFVDLSPQSSLRTAVLRFIKDYGVDHKTYLTVKRFYGNSGLWKGLLLLRGLLAHGILVHVLSQRRWRVDYGLDLKRSLLAVPYRAKDVPSLRSEFGHPDVAVCLTCLSYYYGGLTVSQMRECFELLIKLDNPPLEYEKWVRRGGDDVPVWLRRLIGVNMKDVQKFTNDIVPIFQYNQATVDFFLSQVVFPKHAKEFPSKLGTSGWDLVAPKDHFTTGFSGTNDNSDLLPTSITLTDPVNQLRTNAQVLWYLLQPENDRYVCARGADGQPSSAIEFLEFLVREPKEIRVLLDMLEMTNQQLVAHWLSLRRDVMAGVFFDDADNLSVLTQDGVVESFYSSSFFQLLDQCIVYLDDAHTRGTDLKLPLDFRAAVTLGPKVTKDRLVQGCMRMRKLGYGQSVMFCAPPEVDRRIREIESIHSSSPVKVIDVLSWVMSNTCSDIEHHIPHWVQQGVDFHKRHAGDASFSASESDVKLLKDAWLQPAARSLNEMYGLTAQSATSSNLVNDIPAMHERLRKLGVTAVRDARMEEEQEREVSHEVEQELQLERPPQTPPAVHRLDEDVRSFVRRGTIPSRSHVFFPLMTPLCSEEDSLSPPNPWSSQLLATRDFMTTTINGREKSFITDYLRPVNWLVSRVLSDGRVMLVVMSPYEVNHLIQEIRESKYVRLHMYAPRTTQATKTFENLTFYCVPPLSPSGHATLASLSLDVRCQLNVWAGQLYLDSYEMYLCLCLLLGISSSQMTGYSSVQSDRFVPKSGRIGEMVDVCLFDQSPVTLLKMLFGSRRKGMSYQQTHVGKILHARLLSREDFP